MVKAVRAASSLNAQHREGMAALGLATLHGYVEVIELLVKAGADLMIANNNEKTPMDIVRTRPYYRCIELLQVSGGV